METTAMGLTLSCENRNVFRCFHQFFVALLLCLAANVCAEDARFAAGGYESLQVVAQSISGDRDFPESCGIDRCTVFNSCQSAALPEVSSPDLRPEPTSQPFPALQPTFSAHLAEPASPPPRPATA